MKPERKRRVQELYQIALDLPPAERDAFLDRECRNDSQLRERVRSLLAHYEAAPQDFLQSPAASWGRAATDETIGPYDLEEVLGEGGMGVVYRATQRQPIRRPVALKVLKLGMDSKEVLARFDVERQALAQLTHPYIARVYDAGTASDGRPYFVMEYVDGVPITQYCDEHRLTPDERIKLFIEVCRGMQHAHQQGIIHRDLKPTNILVSGPPEQAEPKIIDFGVAKATEQKLTEATLFTQHGQLIGTPEYMSPEQAHGTAVDIRTDIYSLGTVLYELLVGVLPLDAVELRGAGFEAMMRMIREQDPPRPSTRVSTLGESASDTALRRRTEPRTLARALRGELDWIALKALEKDRERRYGTAAEFAADLQRHLNHEPVTARPASAAYTLSKFARRHPLVVGISATIAGALMVFAVAMTIQANRIAHERDRANHEAQVALQVQEFLFDIFESSEPAESRGAETTARELLDRGAARIDEIKDPVVRAELCSSIGLVYQSLALYPQADSLHTRAYKLWTAERGPLDPQALSAMNNLGNARIGLGHYAQAESIYGLAVARWEEAGLEDDPRAIDPRENLAIEARLQGDWERAAELQEKVVEQRRIHDGPENEKTLAAQGNLGVVYRESGRHEEAESLLLDTLEMQRRVLGRDHPQTLGTMHKLGILYRNMERYDEAESVLLESRELVVQVHGKDDPRYATTNEALAQVYYYQERYERAGAMIAEILEYRRRTLGPEHPNTIIAMNNMASMYLVQKRYEEALAMMQEVLNLHIKVSGDDHFRTQYSRIGLAMCYAHLGQYEEVVPLFQAALDRGYSASDFMTDEINVKALQPMRGDPQLEALIEEIRRRGREKEASG